MTNQNMYLKETCAGYAEKCGDRRKDRLRRIQWFISEFILLCLFVAVGILWYEDAAQHRGNYVTPSLPKAVQGQSVSAEVPVPVNMQRAGTGPIFALVPVGNMDEDYYAGPIGELIKEPNEITIVIDPGHGGVDEGCARGGVREKDINLSIALEVQKRLTTLGYQVVMTRDTDESLSLGERVQTASEAKADIFVSIHQNSSNLYKVNGLEIYYSAKNAQSDSRRLAELIHKDVLLDTGVKARSIFEWEDIHVIREARMPACLIETGFLTNASERRKLSDPSYQNLMAEGIVSGIDAYFHPYVTYLTFDAAVTEKDTKTMLSTLKEENIKAVFFVTRKTAKENPDTVRQLADAGHTIGIYGDWQDYRTVYADVDAYLADLKDTFETVAKAADNMPVLFQRKEKGSIDGTEISKELMQELEKSGFAVYDWKPGL